mgnify:CR=1 FL=1
MVALKQQPCRRAESWRQPKQERRGGIETGTRLTYVTDGILKQERRGGIETQSQPGPEGDSTSKQERRGGIETVEGDNE